MTLLARFCLLACLFLLGCGSSDNSAESTTNTGSSGSSASDDVKTIDTSSLPKLGDYLPEQDEGRITIAPPKDWNLLQRSNTYLAAFNKDKGGRLPSIVVKVAEPTVTGFDNVTADNVAAFATAIQDLLSEKYPGDEYEKNISEDVRAMIIGDLPAARYVKGARFQNRPVDIQIVTTVRGGRMYSVELQVDKGTVLNNRDAAYAVAGGLKFSSGAAKEAAPSADAEKKTDDKK